MIKFHANFAEIDYSCVMDMIVMIAVKIHRDTWWNFIEWRLT